MKERELKELSDAELVARVNRLVQQHRVFTAELLAHIAEMDERKLYREHACSSMFVYVTDRWHLPEASAYKHINAGRVARKFPLIFDLLAAGDTHLNEDNHRELLSAARHKSKRQVELLVAERFPKAPVPARIRKLPEPRVKPKQEEEGERSDCRPVTTATPSTTPLAAGPLVLTASDPGLTKPGKVKPLAAARFKVEFTAHQELYDNIEKAKALLGPSLLRGELSELFFLAMRNFVEDLENKKYAKTSRPRRAPEQANGSRHIPNHVKREVVAREGAQCTFVDENGNRCQEQWGLEFHHDEVPFARGGSSAVQNTTLHCKAHNQLMAERDFGADFIAAKKAPAKAKKLSPVMSP